MLHSACVCRACVEGGVSEWANQIRSWWWCWEMAAWPLVSGCSHPSQDHLRLPPAARLRTVSTQSLWPMYWQTVAVWSTCRSLGVVGLQGDIHQNLEAHSCIELTAIANWWATTQLLIILTSRTFRPGGLCQLLVLLSVSVQGNYCMNPTYNITETQEIILSPVWHFGNICK